MPNTREHSAASTSTRAVMTHSRSFECMAAMLWAILLWTWIKPLASMSGWTEPNRIIPLLAAVGVCIVLDILHIPAKLSVPLKGLCILLTVGWLFRNAGGHSGIGIDWLRIYGEIVREDIKAVAVNRLHLISAETRTVIFLTGWALLAGVVQSIIIFRKRGLWLTGITWIYLLVLQLWPGIDTGKELLAAGVAGVALLSILQLERIKQARGKDTPAETPAIRIDVSTVPPAVYAKALLLALLLFVMALAGSVQHQLLIRPLSGNVWGGIVHNIQKLGLKTNQQEAMAVFSGRLVEGVIGYSSDDGRLGGPVAVQDQLVFTARTPLQTYWRGESRNYYDGSGWSQRQATASVETEIETLQPTLQPTLKPTEKPTDRIIQEIMYAPETALNILFAGGVIDDVKLLITQAGTIVEAEQAVYYDPFTELREMDSEWGRLEYAKLQVLIPQVTTAELLAADGSIPDEIASIYLQLPDSLPERIRQLSQFITSNAETPYAKAFLLEQYLRNNYAYSLTDAAYPRNNQDFVEAFLFESQSGYCDYFSTAMVVMLRTIGVPARWVKGFAPGEIVADARETGETREIGEAGGVKTVLVSTRNAHSWVEAYIPTIGWVGFEPTPGNTGFADGTDELLLTILNEQSTPLPEGYIEMQAQLARDAYRPDDSLSAYSWTNWTIRTTRTVADIFRKLLHYTASLLQPRTILMLAPTLIPLLLAFIWRRRLTLLLLYLMLHLNHVYGNHQTGEHTGIRRLIHTLLNHLQDRVWAQIFKRYSPLAPGQTLREYAAVVDSQIPATVPALSELIHLHEISRYSQGEPVRTSPAKLLRLWSDLDGKKAPL